MVGGIAQDCPQSNRAGAISRCNKAAKSATIMKMNQQKKVNRFGANK